MGVDIGPRIGIDGEKEFRQQLSNINQVLRTLNSEMKAVTSEFEDNEASQESLAKQADVLTRQIQAQEKKLAQLTQGYEQAAGVLGDTDTKTLRWAQSVQDATADLNKLRGQLQKVETGMDDLGDAAEESSDRFDGLKNLGQTLAAGFAVGTVIDGIKDLGGAILDLEESTREYRSVLGTLEVSSQNAGFTAEETAAAYERLYGVLGDTQTTATTIANLQATGVSQEALMRLIDQTTGAWSKYGDSIPIDGLAEAINETTRSGEVTGVLADVLNWGTREGETFGVMLKENTEANQAYNEAVQNASTAEDYFNIALGECETQSERVQLIMQALADQDLQNLGQAWRDTNEDIIALNESESKLEQQWARFGEMVAPAVTALKQGLGTALEGVLDLLDGAIAKAKGFFDSLAEWGRTAPTLGGLLSDLTGWEDPRVDGSHALGLSYVPWDGYIAELHQGEMVLTSAQAEALKSHMTRGVRADTSGLNTLGAGIVNGIQTAMSGMNGGGSYTFNLVLPSGEILARYQLPALIDVARASGTPILNPSMG